MLYYDRIDVSEGIGAILIIIGIFLDKGFKFQHFVYNGCHNVLMMSMNLGNIAI